MRPFIVRTGDVSTWSYPTKAEAGVCVESDQYCNAKTETIITKNTKGEVINKQTVETLVCDDGAKDFLAYPRYCPRV